MKPVLIMQCLFLSSLLFAGDSPLYPPRNLSTSQGQAQLEETLTDISQNKIDISQAVDISSNQTIGGNKTFTGTVSGISGRVLQIVSYTSTVSSTTNSTSFVGTNLMATITPTSATSKIFIIATGDIRGDNLAYVAYTTFWRNGSNILHATQGGQAFGGTNTTTGGYLPVCMTYLDSPNSTSALTYQVAFRTNEATVKADWNSQTCTASIVVVEIGQ